MEHPEDCIKVVKTLVKCSKTKIIFNGAGIWEETNTEQKNKEKKWQLLLTVKTKYEYIMNIKDQIIKISMSEITKLLSITNNN